MSWPVLMISFFMTVMPLWADSFMDYYADGISFYNQGRYEQAIWCYEKADEIQPNNWKICAALGSAYVKLNKKDKAIVEFKRSLAANPDNRTLEKYLATLVKSQDSASYFYWGIATGFDIPGSNWQPAYTTAPGGRLSFGFNFNKDFSIGLDIDTFIFSGFTTSFGSISDIEFRTTLNAEYRFDLGGSVKPYVVAGYGPDFEFLGVSDEIYYEPVASTSEVNSDLFLGLGVEWEMTHHTFLYLEGRYNNVLSVGASGTDTPVLLGLRCGI